MSTAWDDERLAEIARSVIADAKATDDDTARLAGQMADAFLEARQAALNSRHRHKVDFDNWKRDRSRFEHSGPARLDGQDVWRWNPDGENHPESLSCPVVISADDLRTILVERDRAVADRDRFEGEIVLNKNALLDEFLSGYEREHTPEHEMTLSWIVERACKHHASHHSEGQDD